MPMVSVKKPLKSSVNWEKVGNWAAAILIVICFSFLGWFYYHLSQNPIIPVDAFQVESYEKGADY